MGLATALHEQVGERGVGLLGCPIASFSPTILSRHPLGMNLACELLPPPLSQTLSETLSKDAKVDKVCDEVSDKGRKDEAMKQWLNRYEGCQSLLLRSPKPAHCPGSLGARKKSDLAPRGGCLWHPSRMHRGLSPSPGGLRCAAAPGYFLPSLRDDCSPSHFSNSTENVEEPAFLT